MTARIPDLDRLEVTAAQDLWDWLATYHGRADGVLLVTWKAAHRDRYVGRDEVLDAVIAHGWIDGRRYALDDDRTMQLISPRRHHAWAKSYRDRAERLRTEGRMHPSGEAAIAAAITANTWLGSEAVDALIVPDDLRAALETRSATPWFDAAAPSYRRNVLRWITGAKTEPTRAKRIAVVADHAARGEKVPNY